MKYYILVDILANGTTYKSEVKEYTEKELSTSIGYFRNALHYDDNIQIENIGNVFVIRTRNIVAVSHIKVD